MWLSMTSGYVTMLITIVWECFEGLHVTVHIYLDVSFGTHVQFKPALKEELKTYSQLSTVFLCNTLTL